MQIIPGVNPAEKQIIANLRDITKRKKAEDEIIQLNTVLAAQAKTDGLTGLANRRRFDEVLASEWARSIRLGTALSLLMIDVDRFKLYNDRYGHQQGDLCLKTISDVIKGAVRRPGDLAARYGGEEIVVVLPETGEAGAREVAESIRRAVEDAAIPHMDNVPWRLATASIGVATLHPSPSDTTPGTLVSDADEALYHAKASGRNRVSVSKGHPALCDQGILIDLFPAPR
jgi:diguanylate cyclase (GGDEF)-like protein